jgi:hypothetical protein
MKLTPCHTLVLLNTRRRAIKRKAVTRKLGKRAKPPYAL